MNYSMRAEHTNRESFFFRMTILFFTELFRHSLKDKKIFGNALVECGTKRVAQIAAHSVRNLNVYNDNPKRKSLKKVVGNAFIMLHRSSRTNPSCKNILTSSGKNGLSF